MTAKAKVCRFSFLVALVALLAGVAAVLSGYRSIIVRIPADRY